MTPPAEPKDDRRESGERGGPLFWRRLALGSSALFFLVSGTWLEVLLLSLTDGRWFNILAMGIAALAVIVGEASLWARAVLNKGAGRLLFGAIALGLALLQVGASSISVLGRFGEGDIAKEAVDPYRAERARLEALYAVELSRLDKASGDSFRSPEATRNSLEATQSALKALPEAPKAKSSSLDAFGSLRVLPFLRSFDLRTAYSLSLAALIEIAALAALAAGLAPLEKKRPLAPPKILYTASGGVSHIVSEIRADGACLTVCGRLLATAATQEHEALCIICQNKEAAK